LAPERSRQAASVGPCSRRTGEKWADDADDDAAAGADPSVEFRRRLRDAGCVDLETNRSAFNHAERARVGLRREWYDATLWPPEDECQGGGSDADDASARLPRLPPVGGASPPALLVEQLCVRLGEALAMEAEAAAASNT